MCRSATTTSIPHPSVRWGSRGDGNACFPGATPVAEFQDGTPAQVAAPDIRAGLEESGLNIGAVTCIGRNGYSSYSRTFVDGRGYLWYMNRQAQFYRIDPRRDYSAEMVGTLAHPECWTTTSSPVPHGNRIYVRTFGRLTCPEDPKAAAGQGK